MKWLIIAEMENGNMERMVTFADTKERAIAEIKKMGNYIKVSAYDYYWTLQIDCQIFGK